MWLHSQLLKTNVLSFIIPFVYSRLLNHCKQDTGQSIIKSVWDNSVHVKKSLLFKECICNMITLFKQTMLKEVLTVCLDSRLVIQLEVTQAWSTWQKTEVNSSYFYRLGLRWFSHLIYTHQNQYNNRNLSRKDFFPFPLRWMDYPLTSMHTDKLKTVFLKAFRQKVPYIFLVCAFTSLPHVQWEPWQ